MKCSINGCEKDAEKRGWCGMHYRRWRMYGDVHYSKTQYHRDLVGQRFGRLTVLQRVPKAPPRGRAAWECLCDCGNKRFTDTSSLVTGNTMSCGCLKREIMSKAHRTHGLTRSPTYRSWADMMTRCTNPKRDMYRYYGGRGIGVCERWRSFENFLADMGERPAGTTLDRYPDINGHYDPSNCRWANAEQQANNTTANRIIEFRGERRTLAEWARHVGLRPQLLAMRLFRGWSIEDALLWRRSEESYRRTPRLRDSAGRFI